MIRHGFARPVQSQPSVSAASNAARSHSTRSPSIATTSKRHGGSEAQRGAGSAAPRTRRRRCLVAPTLAAAPPCAAVAPRAHLDEHQRAVALAQDQVDFAAARARPARDPIIAPHQRQPVTHQMREGARLGRVSLRPSSCRLLVTTLDASLLLQAAAAAAGDRSTIRRRTVRGGHADRQPRRHDACARSTCWRWSMRSPARTRATARRCCATRPATSRCIAVHQHNEREAAAAVLERLARGERVAYISDAGTPAISDPGAALVAAAQAAGYRCGPLPGASSVVAALSVSRRCARQRLRVRRLPAGARARNARARSSGWRAARRTQVLFEAPHRIADAWPTAWPHAAPRRRVTVCRELTKQFETRRDAAGGRRCRLAGGRCEPRARRVRARPACAASVAVATATMRPPARRHDAATLLAALPLKQAVALAAELTGARAQRALRTRARVEAAMKALAERACGTSTVATDRSPCSRCRGSTPTIDAADSPDVP